MKTKQFFLALLTLVLITVLAGCNKEISSTPVAEKPHETQAVSSESGYTTLTEAALSEKWIQTRIKEITAACREKGRTQEYVCVKAEFAVIEKETSDLRSMAVYGPKAKTYPALWVQQLKDRVVATDTNKPLYRTCMINAGVEEAAMLYCALVERAWIEKHYNDLESGYWKNTQTLTAIPEATTKEYEENTGD